jgi:hypothetical protein
MIASIETGPTVETIFSVARGEVFGDEGRLSHHPGQPFGRFDLVRRVGNLDVTIGENAFVATVGVEKLIAD